MALQRLQAWNRQRPGHELRRCYKSIFTGTTGALHGKRIFSLLTPRRLRTLPLGEQMNRGKSKKWAALKAKASA